MTIERIVRPFQTSDVTPPRRIISAYEVAPQDVVLSFGKGGSGKSMHGAVSTTTTKYMDTHEHIDIPTGDKDKDKTPKASSKKRLTNPDAPDDSAQTVNVPIVDQYVARVVRVAKQIAALAEHSTDPYKLQKEIVQLVNASGINEKPTDRKVKPNEIIHRAVDENGYPVSGVSDDPSQRIFVEQLQRYSTSTGNYDKFIHERDDEKSRKTHVERIENKNNADIWADVERLDESTTLHGSGPTFRRTITKIKWNDEAFNNADVPIVEGNPGGSIDPPWRLDPFQRIVNVQWGGGVTVVGISVRWDYYFVHSADTTAGTLCNPVTEEFPDYIQRVWTDGTASYSFELATGSPFIEYFPPTIAADTTWTASVTVPPGETLSDCTGFAYNPEGIIINVIADSFDLPMVRGMLEGSPVCYGILSNPTFGRFGRIPVRHDFTASVFVSGASATLLGKPADRVSTQIINTLGSDLTVIVGFSWDIPPGFDLGSGEPLPP